MTAITLLEDYRQNKFKDTLFETVADVSWGLEFSSILLETRQGLETAINEWIKYCEQYFMLTEAESMSDEQADDVINQFLARRTIPRSNLDTLHNKVTSASSTKPPSGMMAKFKSMAAKFLAPIQKFLSKLNQKTTYPPVDDAIQAIIRRIEEKTDNDPLIKKLLQGILAIAKKGGWLGSAALIVMGVAQTILGLPFLGTAGIAISIIAVAARIIADLAAGKSLAYTMGKAAALWGLGYGARQLFDLVWPLLQQAESLPVPPIPPEVRAGASSTPQDFDPTEWAPTDSSQGEIPGDADAAVRALGGPITNLPSTGNSYIDKLQDLYGAPIESYSGSFRDAFAAARKELGTGGIFSWTDPTTGQIKPFTTNTKG
jgi:hypothetical protein